MPALVGFGYPAQRGSPTEPTPPKLPDTISQFQLGVQAAAVQVIFGCAPLLVNPALHALEQAPHAEPLAAQVLTLEPFAITGQPEDDLALGAQVVPAPQEQTQVSK